MSQLPFGKYINIELQNIPTSYLDWLIGQDWFCNQFIELKAEVDNELSCRQDWIDNSFME
jgi:uncharacterized protein (DUF3820 family)